MIDEPDTKAKATATAARKPAVPRSPHARRKVLSEADDKTPMPPLTKRIYGANLRRRESDTNPRWALPPDQYLVGAIALLTLVAYVVRPDEVTQYLVISLMSAFVALSTSRLRQTSTGDLVAKKIEMPESKKSDSPRHK